MLMIFQATGCVNKQQISDIKSKCHKSVLASHLASIVHKQKKCLMQAWKHILLSCLSHMQIDILQSVSDFSDLLGLSGETPFPLLPLTALMGRRDSGPWETC